MKLVKMILVLGFLPTLAQHAVLTKNLTNQCAPAFPFRDLGERPSWKSLNDLQQADLPMLMEAYQNYPITNKVALAWAIAHFGNEDSLAVLREPLERDYSGGAMTSPEIGAMKEILAAIGYLGQRFGNAYDFLVEGLTPEQWELRRRWVPDASVKTASIDVRLVGASLLALGITGHPEARQVVENLANREDQYMKTIAGNVVSAVFYTDYIQTHGNNEFIAFYLDSVTSDQYQQFIKTDLGRKWDLWYRAKKNLPPPVE